MFMIYIIIVYITFRGTLRLFRWWIVGYHKILTHVDSKEIKQLGVKIHWQWSVITARFEGVRA